MIHSAYPQILHKLLFLTAYLQEYSIWNNEGYDTRDDFQSSNVGTML